MTLGTDPLPSDGAPLPIRSPQDAPITSSPSSGIIHRTSGRTRRGPRKFRAGESSSGHPQIFGGTGYLRATPVDGCNAVPLSSDIPGRQVLRLEAGHDRGARGSPSPSSTTSVAPHTHPPPRPQVERLAAAAGELTCSLIERGDSCLRDVFAGHAPPHLHIGRRPRIHRHGCVMIVTIFQEGHHGHRRLASRIR